MGGRKKEEEKKLSTVSTPPKNISRRPPLYQDTLPLRQIFWESNSKKKNLLRMVQGHFRLSFVLTLQAKTPFLNQRVQTFDHPEQYYHYNLYARVLLDVKRASGFALYHFPGLLVFC